MTVSKVERKKGGVSENFLRFFGVREKEGGRRMV